MIRNSGSFILEYPLVNNPVLYMMNEDRLPFNSCELCKDALDAHYKALNLQDIEDFIEMLISNDDPMIQTCESYLANEYGEDTSATACENIITTILYK